MVMMLTAGLGVSEMTMGCDWPPVMGGALWSTEDTGLPRQVDKFKILSFWTESTLTLARLGTARFVGVYTDALDTRKQTTIVPRQTGLRLDGVKVHYSTRAHGSYKLKTLMAAAHLALPSAC